MNTIKASELDEAARTLLLVELGGAFMFDDRPPDPNWAKEQALEILASDSVGPLAVRPDGRPWLSPAFVDQMASEIRKRFGAPTLRSSQPASSGPAAPGEVPDDQQDVAAPDVPDWKRRMPR